MMETHFFLGQSMEWSQIFSDDEIGKFTGTIIEDLIFLSQERKQKVHESWTTYVVLSLIMKWLANPAGIIVQQEMVYIHPVYIGDRITARAQVIGLDQSGGWITLSATGTNQYQETILTGQVIVKLQSQEVISA
jgi:acyl dehydratase